MRYIRVLEREKKELEKTVKENRVGCCFALTHSLNLLAPIADQRRRSTRCWGLTTAGTGNGRLIRGEGAGDTTKGTQDSFL